MSDEVLYEQRGAAAWLTLNRPDKRNALNGAVIQGLREGLRRAHADDSVRAIVLTGAGDKAFCAGADLQPGVGFVFDPAKPASDYADLLRVAAWASRNKLSLIHI